MLYFTTSNYLTRVGSHNTTIPIYTYGHDPLDRYRVRHAYIEVFRNVFFRRTDGNVVVREKNLEVQGDLVDNKKKKLSYNAEAKVIVSGKPIISNSIISK